MQTSVAMRTSRNYAFGVRPYKSVNALNEKLCDWAERAILEDHDPDRPRLPWQLDRQDLKRQVTATKTQDRGRQRGDKAPARD
jgi:hypothetical protein